jgi:hypothetical protein
MIDEYLIPNASFLRLLSEYQKYGSIVVAYDFDNTVFDFHKKGKTYEQVMQLIRDLKDANCYMICFTAATDKKFMLQYLSDNNIPFDAINENPPFFKCDERKIYYNAYLDDRAGLLQVYSELTLLLKIINNKHEH